MCELSFSLAKLMGEPVNLACDFRSPRFLSPQTSSPAGIFLQAAKGKRKRAGKEKPAKDQTIGRLFVTSHFLGGLVGRGTNDNDEEFISTRNQVRTSSCL